MERFAKIPLLTEVGSFDTSLSTLANYKSVWEKEETFRNLSATLQFRVPDQENNVIGVTSASKGEGKTFCALNLAVNYAKAGKKTGDCSAVDVYDVSARIDRGRVTLKINNNALEPAKGIVLGAFVVGATAKESKGTRYTYTGKLEGNSFSVILKSGSCQTEWALKRQ